MAEIFFSDNCCTWDHLSACFSWVFPLFTVNDILYLFVSHVLFSYMLHIVVWSRDWNKHLHLVKTRKMDEIFEMKHQTLFLMCSLLVDILPSSFLIFVCQIHLRNLLECSVFSMIYTWYLWKIWRLLIGPLLIINIKVEIVLKHWHLETQRPYIQKESQIFVVVSHHYK